MPRNGLTLKERWGRGWVLFIVSLILAFFVWLIHNLSLDYFSYLQFRLSITTSIEGYEPEAVAEESLVIHGKAPGIFFLRNSRIDGFPKDMELSLNPILFHEDDLSEGYFYVKTNDIREALSEFFGEQMDIDYFSPEVLHFQFEKASCKKVEVIPRDAVTYKPQYMLSGDILISPDSIMIYGPEHELEHINSVSTKLISRRMVDKFIQGFVGIERIEGIRTDVDRIQYTLNVQRYVELNESLEVNVINLPADKSLVLLPSTVNITYRVPFKQMNGKGKENDLKLVVDWTRFAESKSSKVIPEVVSTSLDIFSFTLDPPLVECIQVER